MARSFFVVGLALVSVFFAGCTASSAQPASTSDMPPSIVEAQGEQLVDAGSIRATVIDDAALPVVGAIVGIPDLSLNAATDQAGVAVFTNLPPGPHQVAAAQLGYTSAAKAVTVEPGVETAVTLTIVAIVLEVPFHETFGPLLGYFDCRMGVRVPAYGAWTSACGQVSTPVGFVGPQSADINPWPNDNSILKFPVANNGTATAIGDMRWSPSAVGTSTSLRFAFSYDGRPSSHWWCAGEGPSVLSWRWEADEERESVCANVGSSDEEPFPRTHNDDGEPMTMRVYANAPFGNEQTPMYLTLQQKFEIVTTIFYHTPAPDAYSGFGDA